jgi:hypothetical protein
MSTPIFDEHAKIFYPLGASGGSIAGPSNDLAEETLLRRTPAALAPMKPAAAAA